MEGITYFSPDPRSRKQESIILSVFCGGGGESIEVDCPLAITFNMSARTLHASLILKYLNVVVFF